MMYAIIEYSDSRITHYTTLHGIKSDKDSAIEYVKNLLNERISRNGGYIYEIIDPYNDVKYGDLTNKEKIEFRLFDIEKEDDDKIKKYIKNSLDQSLEEFISDCINGDYPTKYEEVRNKKVSEFSIEEIRDILEYLSINNSNMNFGPERYFSDTSVLAIVEERNLGSFRTS